MTLGECTVVLGALEMLRSHTGPLSMAQQALLDEAVAILEGERRAAA